MHEDEILDTRLAKTAVNRSWGSTAASNEPVPPTAPELTVNDTDNLRHMLGVSERHPRGYRNYYVAGADDVPSMERLLALGLVVKNERYRLSEDACYHATDTGARFIGLERLPR